ncbi:MAG TPA: wax ester/triacylglycerol synthase family O-acyltransferase [Solirubrobacteraceae bacterium]|nr:wax ester/triacylglycerol synthase family O-acyltransferase [Solirubrobacteraceae bacterium]
MTSTRFSSADAAWLRMDQPTNLMVITSLSLFDSPVDWARFREITQRRLVDRYPRFRQRVVESRLPLRPPKWQDDPDFALEHHLHHIALPAPGDEAALRALVSDIMTLPLDHNRPLWHIYMVDGFGPSGAATIARMHHCIADGVALARVLLSLTDSEPDAGIGPAAAALRLPATRLRIGGVPLPRTRLLSRTADLGLTVARQGAEIATSPSHAARLAGAVARDGATALRLLLTPADAATAIKGDPGISRRVAWTRPLPLAEIKTIAHRHDATVNDVLLAGVAGGLRHYLQECGGPVAEIQAMVPVNLRPLDRPIPSDLGNRFGLVMLPLPVGTSGAYRRLTEVHRRMNEIKQGRDGQVSYGILSLAGLVPEAVERAVIDVFSGKGTAVMTNVIGPAEIVYMAGTPVRSVLFWAPTSGHIGMSVSIFSYRGEVTVGLMVDAALVPDPDAIAQHLERELEALAALPQKGRRRSARRPREPAIR